MKASGMALFSGGWAFARGLALSRSTPPSASKRAETGVFRRLSKMRHPQTNDCAVIPKVGNSPARRLVPRATAQDGGHGNEKGLCAGRIHMTTRSSTRWALLAGTLGALA